MDILKKAVEFAKEIRKTKEYFNLKVAKEQNDNDSKLQNLINEFNLLKLKIQHRNEQNILDDETQKAKYKSDSILLSQCYDKIMENEHMLAFNDASEKMNFLMENINKILLAAVNGKALENVNDLLKDENCSGDCSGCSSCF